MTGRSTSTRLNTAGTNDVGVTDAIRVCRGIDVDVDDNNGEVGDLGVKDLEEQGIGAVRIAVGHALLDDDDDDDNDDSSDVDEGDEFDGSDFTGSDEDEDDSERNEDTDEDPSLSASVAAPPLSARSQAAWLWHSTQQAH